MATEKELERVEDRLPDKTEMLPAKAWGRWRWRQIFYRSGLTTLALGAGLGTASLLHRGSSARAEVLSHNGNCEVAVQVVGVRFVNQVGDPDILDVGDQIVGRAGNFTAFILTPGGQVLRTVFVGSDGVDTTSRFNRRCDTTGDNGQPAVSLQLRTDQSGRNLPFTVEDHNARRVFVGREVEGGAVLVPTPAIPVATPIVTPAKIPTPGGARGPETVVPADWWRWLLVAATVVTLGAIGAWAWNRHEEEEKRRRAAAPPPPPPEPPPPAGPAQPQPVQPPAAGAPQPVPEHEHPIVQRRLEELHRDFIGHAHRIQNIESTLRRQPQRAAEATPPAPQQPPDEGEVPPPVPARVEEREAGPEAPREEQPPAEALERPQARPRRRQRLRVARVEQLVVRIDPEMAEALERMETAEGREHPQLHVEEHHEEPREERRD